MPRRVNPIVLLGIILLLVLSVGILASAQSGGGTAGEAVGVGEAQVGKPFMMATDGPDTFSCVGLMRYILRTTGVDADAPWVPEGYLGKYAPVDLANLQPGDIVIYPGWATMYVGNGTLLNANEAEGVVTHTPMDVAGAPLGAVRPPYGGSSQPQPTATDPMAANPVTDPTTTGMVTDPTTIGPVVDPMAANSTMTLDPMADPSMTLDPMADPSMTLDPVVTDPIAANPIVAADPAVADLPVADPAVVNPVATEPTVQF